MKRSNKRQLMARKPNLLYESPDNRRIALVAAYGFGLFGVCFIGFPVQGDMSTFTVLTGIVFVAIALYSIVFWLKARRWIR